jgi:hypothetical protein
MDEREADDSVMRTLGQVSEEFEQEAQAAQLDAASNKSLLMMAEEMALLTQEIAEHEALLKPMKARREQLRKIDIPDLMRALSMVNGNKGSFTFSLGKLHLETRTFCSINDGEDEQLYAWLETNSLGDLVKKTVSGSALSAVVRERRGEELSDPPHVTVYEETAVKLTLSK